MLSRYHHSLRLLAGALIISALGSALSYVALNPTIGIDDANITQTYAKHIASGNGYVYNVGGERVEGSTSALWTLVNVVAFSISETPETLITVFCFLLTVLIVREVLSFIDDMVGSEVAARYQYLAVGLLFLSNPSLFGWTVWSLMDVALWVLMFSVITMRSMRLAISHDRSDQPTTRSNAILLVGLILLPVTRPEGIAVSIGMMLGLLGFAYARHSHKLRNDLFLTLLATVALFTGVTMMRLWYFGFPFPNTYYAKVSISYVEQALSGLKYFMKYLSQPVSLLVWLLSICGILTIVLRENMRLGDRKWFATCFLSCVGGTFLLYVALGGDHFGSFRQYQVLVPVLVGCAGLPLLALTSVASRLRAVSTDGGARLVVLVSLLALGGSVTMPTVLTFVHDGGGLTHEFTIAEEGRTLGRELNTLPGEPSIGVIAAGGISRTFTGPIYDLMGLNWVEMAHANRRHVPGAPKNHAAFDKTVFLTHLPDIVLPALGPCTEYTTVEFQDRALDGMLQDARFQAQYVRACFGTIVFFARKDYVRRWEGTLRIPKDAAGARVSSGTGVASHQIPG